MITISTYFLCFIAGLLGIALHVFAIKIPSVKTSAKVANMNFSYSAYLQDDLAAILASVLTVIILLVVLDELVAIKPAVVPYLKFGFVTIGYTGSSILIAVLGKAVNKINTVVNIKTDISDQVSPDEPPKQNV